MNADQYISVSSTVAATLGLEEAVMLQCLQNYQFYTASDGATVQNISLSASLAEQIFPFWQSADVQRVAQSLAAKGVLTITSSNFAALELTLNTNKTIRVPAPPAKPGSSATPIVANWQPSEEILIQLAQQGIPHDFAMQQLPEFISYWRERGESAYAWGSKFLQHCLRKWRGEEAKSPTPIAENDLQRNWQPNEDALEILARINIPRQFIDDAIPEFVLYWRERGVAITTWNSKFISHVKRQWSRYNSSLANDSEPHIISKDWQPNEDVYDILRMANIDCEFARGLVKEFILFWRDNKQAHSSWNTKFLQHVKYHWAKRHQLSTRHHESSVRQTDSGKSRTKDRSIADDLSDRSWAY